MKDITVNKGELIKKLRENRDAHHGLYLEALEVYRERALELVREQTELFIRGDVVAIRVNLPVPEDHTEDYDRVLAMLEMAIEDEYVLTESDFAQYVLDEWGWARAFAANTASYVVR